MPESRSCRNECEPVPEPLNQLPLAAIIIGLITIIIAAKH